MKTRNLILASLILGLPTTYGKASTITGETPATGIIGTQGVSASAIKGTWAFSEAVLAFKSQEQEASLGSSAPVTKAQTYLQKGLEKAGISSGKVSFTFNDNGTLAVTVGDKTFNGTYTLEGSNISITGIGKSTTANISLTGGKLQLAMPADKLIALTQSVSATATQASTTLSTVAGLLNSLQGTYVGLVLTK
ncbi:MAG: DUF4923 family protein [Bacteroidaceae bacterium]|nr:DUF4923 family protein [Bacteroidaceae bacterium]